MLVYGRKSAQAFDKYFTKPAKPKKRGRPRKKKRRRSVPTKTQLKCKQKLMVTSGGRVVDLTVKATAVLDIDWRAYLQIYNTSVHTEYEYAEKSAKNGPTIGSDNKAKHGTNTSKSAAKTRPNTAKSTPKLW